MTERKSLTRILVLDNFDSFTYNLVHLLLEIPGVSVDVYKNNNISVADAGTYDRILLSPGPGLPADAGIMPDIIKTYYKTIPMIGICLGHQAIAEAFGGSLINHEVYHGVTTNITFAAESPLFTNISQPMVVGRYHSWLVSPNDFPERLVILAKDINGEIMALRHRDFPVFGVQFHPESIMTPEGKTLIFNWMAFC